MQVAGGMPGFLPGPNDTGAGIDTPTPKPVLKPVKFCYHPYLTVDDHLKLMETGVQKGPTGELTPFYNNFREI